jgi:hypothetical protein
MAFTTAKMSLRIWNLLTDLYDHTQLADNWAKVDYHDHSPGKGVQVPTEGIADGAVTSPKLATALDPSGAYTTFRAARDVLGSIAAATGAGTFGMSETNPAQVTATTHLPGIFYFDPTDYVASGRTTKLRIRTTLTVINVTNTGVNFTVALQPVTAIAAGTLTVGAAVTGSSLVFTAPLGNTLNVASTADFDTPVAGYYVMTIANSGAPGSGVQARSLLGVHQV